MKVKELIEQLKNMDPELPVWNHDREYDYEVKAVEVKEVSYCSEGWNDETIKCCFLSPNIEKLEVKFNSAQFKDFEQYLV